MAFFIVGDIFEVVHMWIATFYQVLKLFSHFDREICKAK